ncbi:hypothetical protein ACFIJ5_10860 [Haloimpatiens sp. FM7330]|uniref:hypothetical protein n=1 Tax=Haloimpatiens sp. FM7330 TaxID=3298610 RepID=UPI003624EE29
MDKDIKRAEERLEYLSSDKETIEIYKVREKSLHERANMINGAKEEGIKEGENKKSIEIIKNSLMQGLSVDIISKITGKNIDEIEKIKKLLN